MSKDIISVNPEDSVSKAIEVAERIRTTVGKHVLHTYSLDGIPTEVSKTVSRVTELKEDDNMESF